MKQYTTPDQTAKLIELGFEKPPKKGLLYQSTIGNCLTDLMLAEENYSIGELIEILDKYQDKLSMVKTEYRWFINYHTKNIELIDSLFDMIVELKEEGVI